MGLVPKTGVRPLGGRDEWNEVGAGEADEARLGGESDVGGGHDQLPVANRGDGHPLPLAGAVDAPSHVALGGAGTTAAISVEQEGTLALAQDPNLRLGIQLALPVEAGHQA